MGGATRKMHTAALLTDGASSLASRSVIASSSSCTDFFDLDARSAATLTSTSFVSAKFAFFFGLERID